MTGKRVLLGVTGGIAAYKAAALASRLVQAGAILDVVLTADAQRFVGAATFAALARRPVHTSLWERVEEIPHIALAREADVFAIVPATANTIAKLALGIADDLLTNIAIATAAVADWRPAVTHAQKVKKSDDPQTIALERNPDVLSNLGARKNGVFLVGFAAETEAFEANARAKLQRKHLDAIAVNDVGGEADQK